MSYSPSLLELMGINIAEDLVNETHQSPEEKLWRYVLINAFEDARIIHSDRKSSIIKMEAHNWITKEEEDFINICWWAGWDPEQVKTQYLKAVQEKKITFTQRQVKWIEYYLKYLVLKDEKDKEKRINLRKAMLLARDAVFNSTTALVTSIICQAYS